MIASGTKVRLIDRINMPKEFIGLIGTVREPNNDDTYMFYPDVVPEKCWPWGKGPWRFAEKYFVVIDDETSLPAGHTRCKCGTITSNRIGRCCDCKRCD